jgi:hypothetical protein
MGKCDTGKWSYGEKYPIRHLFCCLNVAVKHDFMSANVVKIKKTQRRLIFDIRQITVRKLKKFLFSRFHNYNRL